MSFYSPTAGDRVTWWHHDHRGTKDFSGEVIGQSNCGGPYQRVRRDDTRKIVKVRTTALKKA